MKKAQASLRDIARRWRVNPAKPRGKGARPPSAGFLKQALDRQAAATHEPLAKIHAQIETYKLALELLANSSFDPLQQTSERYEPLTRTWKSIYTTTGNT